MSCTKKIISLLLALFCLSGCSAQNTSAPPEGTGSETSGAAVSADSSSPATSSSTPSSSSSSNSSNSASSASPSGAFTFTDALGYEVTVESWERVVSLYGSFSETWVLAGGTLAGTTNDAIEERKLALGEDVAIVGTIQAPNMEEILAVDPDFVILSADTSEHVALHDALLQADIPHAYYRVDTFDSYLEMLGQFCEMTGRQDLYQQNGLAVQEQIDAVLKAVEGQPHPTVLLIRAFSTGAKAKGEDNLAGVILRDLGADNLVSQHESLLEDVSMEEVIAADPDFIFVVTMGSSDEKALSYMAQNFEENPAWSGLSAVKNGRYIQLPKDLFHYKPNARWGESYATLAKILYPDLASQIG